MTEMPQVGASPTAAYASTPSQFFMSAFYAPTATNAQASVAGVPSGQHSAPVAPYQAGSNPGSSLLGFGSGAPNPGMNPVPDNSYVGQQLSSIVQQLQGLSTWVNSIQTQLQGLLRPTGPHILDNQPGQQTGQGFLQQLLSSLGFQQGTAQPAPQNPLQQLFPLLGQAPGTTQPVQQSPWDWLSSLFNPQPAGQAATATPANPVPTTPVPTTTAPATTTPSSGMMADWNSFLTKWFPGTTSNASTAPTTGQASTPAISEADKAKYREQGSVRTLRLLARILGR